METFVGLLAIITMIFGIVCIIRVAVDWVTHPKEPQRSSTVRLQKPTRIISNPDISEPVLSFIDEFRRNHRRFKCRVYYSPTKDHYSHEINYEAIDKQTSEAFLITELRSLYADYFNTTSPNIKYLTRDEKKFLIKNIKEVYADRQKQLQILLNKRLRNKHIDIYCKGDVNDK